MPAEWETQRLIDEFPLGEHDTPDRLLIPEKLYGRDREIKTLVDAFDQVVTTGKPSLVLVLVIPESASPRLLMNFTKCWFRLVVFLRRVSSTSISAMYLTLL